MNSAAGTEKRCLASIRAHYTEPYYNRLTQESAPFLTEVLGFYGSWRRPHQSMISSWMAAWTSASVGAFFPRTLNE